jgi:hypothetical protein
MAKNSFFVMNLMVNFSRRIIMRMKINRMKKTFLLASLWEPDWLLYKLEPLETSGKLGLSILCQTQQFFSLLLSRYTSFWWVIGVCKFAFSYFLQARQLWVIPLVLKQSILLCFLLGFYPFLPISEWISNATQMCQRLGISTHACGLRCRSNLWLSQQES